MKAIVESAGKVASRVRLGSHELIFDQPDSVPGGENRGPSPLDVLAVSVAACTHYFAAAFLHGRGLSTDGLTVEVGADKERAPTPRFARLAMTVHLPSGLSEQQVRVVERAVRQCPALGTLMHPPTVDLSFDSPPAERPEAGQLTDRAEQHVAVGNGEGAIRAATSPSDNMEGL